MNFSKFDMSILIVMSLSVILMSFLFPALGMSDGGAVNESEIPEFNASSSSFDLVGEYPDQPSQPTSGTLDYDATRGATGNSIEGYSLVWINRPKDTGNSLEIQNTSTDGLDVVLTNYSSTGSSQARVDISSGSVGETYLIQEYDWVIELEVRELENYQEPNMSALVDYDIKASPESDEGLSSIPLIGGTADQIAQVVGQIAIAFGWASAVIVQTVISGVLTVFNLAQYMVGMGFWMVSTYTAVVASAPSWASVVLAVPAVLLFAEFAKLTAVVISLLPTT